MPAKSRGMASLGRAESWRWRSLPGQGALRGALPPSSRLSLLPRASVSPLKIAPPQLLPACRGGRGKDTDDGEETPGTTGGCKDKTAFAVTRALTGLPKAKAANEGADDSL